MPSVQASTEWKAGGVVAGCLGFIFGASIAATAPSAPVRVFIVTVLRVTKWLSQGVKKSCLCCLHARAATQQPPAR